MSKGVKRGSKSHFSNYWFLQALIYKAFVLRRLLPTNQKVVGSNPAGLTKKKSPPFMGGDFLCMCRMDSNTRPVREWGNDPSGAPVGHSPKVKTR